MILKTRRFARLYLLMSRPNQLAAVSLVYSWGVIIALRVNPDINPTRLLAILGSLILVSASIHFSNEYVDYETDKLTVRTPFSGGSGALQEIDAPRHHALVGAWVSLVSGFVVAGILSWKGVLPGPALFLLIVGAFGGWMYSLKPLALAWRGWGEVDNAILGGMLLPAFGFSAQAGVLEWRVFAISLPFGLHVFVNLLSTTWPDRTADWSVGKRTLATRWPLKRLRTVYFLTVAVAYAWLFLLAIRLIPGTAALITAPLFPLALWAGARYTRQHSPFPSVLVMVLFLGLQIVGWSLELA